VPESSASLNVHLEKHRDKTHLTLAGRLDSSNVDVLINAFGGIHPADQAGIVVEVGQLDYLSASGLNAIVLAAARFAQRCCPLLVVDANPAVLDALRATALSRMLVWPQERAPFQPTMHAA
jgi:anti-anti-sigma factor